MAFLQRQWWYVVSVGAAICDGCSHCASERTKQGSLPYFFIGIPVGVLKASLNVGVGAYASLTTRVHYGDMEMN
jgi:hypothetical protein